MSVFELTRLVSVAPTAVVEPAAYTPVDGGVASVGWLMIALPLLGAAVLLFGGRRTDSWGPVAATALSWASFVVGVLVILQLRGMAADERGADAAIVFDAGMLDASTPALTVGTRGMVWADVAVTTGERPAHSGEFGGAALNAVHVLHRLLAAVLPDPETGRPPEPLRAGLEPPSAAELRARLERRAEDAPDVILRRLRNAAVEIARWTEYDYVVVNDDLDRCFNEIRSILEAERLRRARRVAIGEFADRLAVELGQTES